MEKVKGIV